MSDDKQVWKAHYWRYHSERWEDFDTPQDAIAFLNSGEDHGELSSAGVVWPDGTERAYDWVEDPDGVKMLQGDTPDRATQV